LNITTSPTEELSASLTKLINSTVEKNGASVVALSGGKSPISLFEHLSTLSLPWQQTTITLVDERVTSIDNTDSNENLLKTHLLKNKAKVATFLGLMHTNVTDLPTLANSKIPQIDIAILGMGSDGHTASIFPDCTELDAALDLDNPNTYITTNPVSAKYSRITLTLKALSKIKYLILAISGEEKLTILQEAAKKINKNYPISYLLNKRPDIQVYWHK
jgi:6-phosphogluconolactonase